MTRADWRDAMQYQYLTDLIPAELAWEFLRRNPEYVSEAAKVDPADPSAATELTANWGLRFRDSTRCPCQYCQHLLDPGRRSERTAPLRSNLPNHAFGECHHRPDRRPAGG